MLPSGATLPQSFEQVLAGINKLNRNLEAVITVGNEFSSVEALWSTFENVMGKPEGEEEGAEEGAAVSGGEEKTAGNRKDARSANQQEERHEEAGAYGEEEEEEL